MKPALGHQIILFLPVAVVAVFWLSSIVERRRGGGPRKPGFVARNGPVIATYLVVAVALWAVVMIVLPQLFMVELSFRPKLPPARVGDPDDVYTLENYRYFLFGSTTSTASWNSVHINAFISTIVISILITIFDLVICYPLAFYMAHVARPARLRMLLLLLIAPYWVNELLRAFAFRIIFATSGLINRALMAIGAVAEPIDFLGRDIGLYAGLSYAYLLLMIFPLYNTIENLERAQIEAARDLGAPWWRIHRDTRSALAMPSTRPGGRSARAIENPTYSGERMPCRRRFRRDQAFPCAVQGPVES